MNNPASFHSFSGLSTSEIAAMQSATFEQKFMDVVAPLVHTLSPKIPIYRDGDRVPVVACPAVPTAPKGKVAHTSATSVDLTTTEVPQTLRSVVARGGSLFVSVPAYPEQRQPLDSLFDPLRKAVEQEKQQSIAQPVKEEPRFPPPKKLKSRPSTKQQPYHPQTQPQQQQQHQQPYPRPPSQYPTVPALAEFRRRIDRPFPFKRECIQKIFKSLLKRPDFQLPEPKRPNQVGRDADPCYCPYHRVLGHVLEDCVTFKEWLEKGLKEKSIVIPEAYLTDPPSRSAGVIFDLTGDATDCSDD